MNSTPSSNEVKTGQERECAKCKRSVESEADLWPVEGGLCQDCWEAFSDAQWWEAVKDLEPTGQPDEYVRVTPQTLQKREVIRVL